MVSRESYWSKHVKRFQGGPDQSLAAYCREYSLAYQTMLYWLRKSNAKSDSSLPGHLVPVKMLSNSRPPPIKITLNEVTIEVEEHFNPALLRDVVSLLKSL